MHENATSINQLHTGQSGTRIIRKDKRPARGYVFVCTTKTKAECFQKSLFGSGKAYGASVLKIREGDILFLNDLSNNTLSGIFRASSNGALNIAPDAWRGKFPYQVHFNIFHDVIELRGAKKILKKIDFSANTILVGDKLGYLIDLFAYREASLDDLLMDRTIKPRDKADNISDDDTPFIEATTLWNFSKQSYGLTPKGDSTYSGVTPALVIYNLIWRYTEPGDLVVDPMCGSGTTIDVCREESRDVRGFDISPVREDIEKADARSLPVESDTVDMVFIDSPYGDNIDYNENPNNLGNISSQDEQFYCELEKVMIESKRILQPSKVLAWLISDQWIGNKFTPVGFKTYELLCKHFKPVDIICVTRRGQASHTEEWINRSRRLNFYLRGFKYLIIMQKPG
jgi:hypothetical protein